MKNKIHIYYWSPFISKVATITAVINSMVSLKKYSENKLEPQLINVAGEWNMHRQELQEKNIKIIDLKKSKIIDNKNHSGYLKSINRRNLSIKNILRKLL